MMKYRNIKITKAIPLGTGYINEIGIIEDVAQSPEKAVTTVKLQLVFRSKEAVQRFEDRIAANLKGHHDLKCGLFLTSDDTTIKTDK